MRTSSNVLPTVLFALAAPIAAQKAALAPRVPCMDPHHPGEQLVNGGYGVELADFDGDGRVDLASEGTPGLQIWKRVQGGSLQLHQTVPEFAFGELTSGDMNGDGLLDLVATGPVGLQGVYVYLNSPGALFKHPIAYGTVPTFSNLQLADLDGDGDLDVVAGDELGPDVDLMLNAGDGSLAVVGSVGTGSHFALGDLDGDGDPDLVGGMPLPGQLILFQNDGLGAFTQVLTIPLSGPGPLVLADLDGDGDGDLASKSTSGVRVFLQTGPLVFAPPVSYATLGQQSGLQAADIDGDGALDLACFDSASVGVLRNIGGGAFDSAGSWKAGGNLFDLSLADQDGDSDLDLAIGAQGFGVTLLENEGGIDFEQAIHLVGSSMLSGVDTGDVDGDGRKDIVTTSSGPSGPVKIYTQGPGGSFTPTSIALEASNLQLADMDGDNDQDLVFLEGGAVQMALNQGSLTFGAPQILVPASISNFVIADFENDGDQDIVAAHVFSFPFTEAFSTLLRNLGGGSFSSEVRPSYPGLDMAVGELNGDGRPDFVSAATNTVGILFSQGATGFAPFSTPVAEPGSIVVKIAIAHLNDDKLADIAMALSTSQIAVSYNRGNGRFGQLQFYSGSGSSPKLLLGADYDNDRRMDLLTASSTDKSINVFRNRARFDLARERAFAIGFLPTTGRATDMNRDGLLDYVIVGQSTLSVILSECR